MTDWIPIFRTGTHTDSTGKERTWTEADLDAIVSSYDPSQHEAPVVIGHPQDNAPAWGWVEALKREGEVLYARLKNMVPEFVDMVRKGLFKKRSISLYPDMTLRHIGWLGAVAPAVKGLADVAFSEEVAMTIEFAATTADTAAQQARGKKWGIGIKDGGNVTKPGQWANVPDEEFLDPVNYRYPTPDADQTRAAASYWGHPDNQAQYSAEERVLIDSRLAAREKHFTIGAHAEVGAHSRAPLQDREPQQRKEIKMQFKEWLKSVFTKAVDEMPPDLEGAPAAVPTVQPETFSETQVRVREEAASKKAREEAEARVRQEFAEQQKKDRAVARKAEIANFCDSLCKAGKLTPAIVKAGLTEVMEFLAASDEVIEFGEAKEKKSHLDLLKGIFETQLPKVIEFGEIASRGQDTGAGDANEKLALLIQAKMKEDKTLSFHEASKVVQMENLDLAKEALNEIRPAR